MALKVTIKDKAAPALLELSREIRSKGVLRNKDGKALIKEIQNVIQNDWNAQSWPEPYMGQGRLQDSFSAGPILKYSNSQTIEVTSNSPYAAIHNRPSTLVRPNGPWLAIPLARAEAFFGAGSLKKSLIWNDRYHIKKAVITMKPKGSSKGYLTIAAERFQDKQSTTITSRIRSIWQKISGRFR